ncbi:MAG: P-II family nitrogen regulator [Gemmatimonadales bacterium]|nr:P-II family nitrogen regulator [Gemmatimonadales bacterium]
MKMLIAYVRPHMAQPVIAALLDAGCEDVLVHEVRRVVGGLTGPEYSFSVTLGQRYEPMTVLVVPAPDDWAETWAGVVHEAGGTGRHGDGGVLVLPVEASLQLSGQL